MKFYLLFVLGLMVFDMDVTCRRYFGMVKEHYEIHGKRFECPFSTLLLLNVDCMFRRLNRTTETWSLDVYIKPEIKVTNLYLKMTVYRKTSSLHYRPTLIINATVDICSNMSNELTSPILMMFMDDVKDHGNVFHPCPYTGHNFIKNHTMQIGALPPIIPGGEYHIKYYFYTIWKGSDHVAFQIHSYFDVVPRGIERF